MNHLPYTIIIVALLSFCSDFKAQCDDTTPSFPVDLSGQPYGSWISPYVYRSDDCCGGGSDNSNCVEFVVTLDTAANGILFDIYEGAAPSGALYYSVDCGPPTSIGTPLCLDGVGPHHVTFCKPGNNANEYIITSLSDPLVTTNGAINNGCSSYINSLNYIESTVVWNSVYPGNVGDWNYYLNCQAGCDSVIVTSTDDLFPPFIDYEICGTPVGGCGDYVCNTVRIEFSTNIDVVLTPNTTLICPTDPGTDINSSVSGGYPPYTYQWSTNETTPSIFVGSGGTYTLVILDQSDCPPTSASVVIDQLIDTITAYAGPDQIVCLGTTEVQLNGSFTGGTSAIWYGGAGIYAQSSSDTNAIYYPTADEISTGSVDLIITNAGVGICPADSDTMTIDFVSFEGINTITTVDPGCFGDQNGSATINTTGSTPNYSYTWNTSPTQTGSSASNIPPGNWTVEVVDGNGCRITETFTISEPAPLTVAYSQTNVSCFLGNDGTATVTPFGGTPPYSYSWTSGGGTDSTALNLTAGTYTATVTDSKGCTISTDITLTEPPIITSYISSLTHVSCAGGNDGSATATVSGGTPGYTYSWSPTIAGTDPTAIGLTAGSYIITITDSNGCEGVANVTINEPNFPISNTITSTDVSCNGGSDGSALITPSGGTAPYSYEWSNTDTDALADGLSVGFYSVIITDTNGCTSTSSVTINEPSILVSEIVGTIDVPCFGLSNGQATVGTSGGTAPYTYVWSSSANTGTTESGLAAGSYTVTTTDALGCVDIDNVTINQPQFPLTSTTDQVNNPCNGDNLGAAMIIPNGGTAPYTYFWSLPSINDTIKNLPAGTYDVTVTDTNGCTTTNGVTITEPPAIVVTVSGVDVTCGVPSGEVHATISGGTTPYVYAWNPGGANLDVYGLTTGIYTFNVTDALGCSESEIMSLSSINGATASITSVSDVNCYGGSDGSATATASGGTPPLTYLWTSGGTGFTESGLSAGSYTFSVTDGNGCESFATAVITEPDTIISAMQGYNVSCNGGNDGSAVVSVSGGTGAGTYSYSWNNTAAITDSVSLLSVGMQIVTVTDANGCIVTDSILITQPSPLGLNISGTNLNCFGDNSGTASGIATGGVGNYTYSWSPSGGTTANATGLEAGSYTLTVMDQNNCSINNNITLSQPSNPLSTNTIATNASCNGFSDGEAITTPSGGTAPYTYQWSNTDTDAIAENLFAGTLSVVITDFNGCMTTDQITIGQPPVLTTNITNVVNTFCELANGGATVTATGGTLPYSYLWSNTVTSNSISNVSQGSYSVIVTDFNGCNKTEFVTIGNTTSPQITITSQTNVSCNGGYDGTAIAAGSFGDGNYTYMWHTSGIAQATATGLGAGQHTVYLTDGNGCIDSATIFISQPQPLAITVDQITDPLCFGGSNGSIEVSATGGTAPYSYSWTNGDNTSTATNLSLGSYTVTVTDALSCSTSLSALVSQPPSLTSSISAFTDERCIDAFDGTATVSVQGGTPGYSYLWDDGNSQTAATAIGLAPGNYNVTVQDDNGCTSTSMVSIGSPSPVITSAISADTICFGASTTLTASASGGAGNYQYFWSNGVGITNPAIVSPTAETTYGVTAIDQYGCQGNTVPVKIIVYSMTQSDVGIFGQTPICLGSSSLIYAYLNSTTTGPVTYDWSPNLGDSAGAYVVTQSQPTTYVVTITNSCGVSFSDSVFVDFKPQPTIDFTTDIDAGCQALQVSFTDQSTSNSPGDVISSWLWDFGDGGQSTLQNPIYVFNNAGVFVVNLTIASSAGCLSNDSTFSDTITVYPVPNADFEVEGMNNSFDMETTFINLSENAISYTWDFGDGGNSTIDNPVHEYATEGRYQVILIATSDMGCKDTLIKDHIIESIITLYVPNSFTPDGDGINDTFFANGDEVDESNFRLWIYNRWGEVVYNTDNYSDQWDGKTANGMQALMDTYVWVIHTQDMNGKRIELMGHVNLLR